MSRLMTLMALLTGFSLGLSAYSADGPEVFKANNCVKCHAIEALGIAHEPGELDEGEEPKEPEDLSKIGSEVDEAHIVAFLKRLEPSHGNNKKHKKKFKGTDEEIQILATWLASLK